MKKTTLSRVISRTAGPSDKCCPMGTDGSGQLNLFPGRIQVLRVETVRFYSVLVEPMFPGVRWNRLFYWVVEEPGSSSVLMDRPVLLCALRTWDPFQWTQPVLLGPGEEPVFLRESNLSKTNHNNFSDGVFAVYTGIFINLNKSTSIICS